jgi:hypothetical protein
MAAPSRRTSDSRKVVGKVVNESVLLLSNRFWRRLWSNHGLHRERDRLLTCEVVRNRSVGPP